MYTINNGIYLVQSGKKYFGILQVQVVCEEAGSRPVENAGVQVFHKSDPNTVIVDLITDISGKTTEIELPAPPIEYSMEPTTYQPYSEYRLVITAPGLQTLEIDSVQLFPYVKTVQPVKMPRKINGNEPAKTILIGPHFLCGKYPPKIYEDEVKDNIVPEENKPILIPEFIIVHDGIPSDAAAGNYKIEYRDYIKNVVSCQIYATWPLETIYANILTILSFSLNRIYTDWYPSQGYDFTITSSTAFDQIWIYGRNVNSNICLAVDYIFNYFLSLPDITQPILAQAGNSMICSNMISLWDSKFLGDQTYKALDILRYYYGDMLYINHTDNIAGVIAWPNTELKEGITSEEVEYIQKQLRILSCAYYEIPLINADGIYEENTKAAVCAFQKIFDLPVTGTVDAATWYKISHTHASITRPAGSYTGNSPK